MYWKFTYVTTRIKTSHEVVIVKTHVDIENVLKMLKFQSVKCYKNLPYLLRYIFADEISIFLFNISFNL